MTNLLNKFETFINGFGDVYRISLIEDCNQLLAQAVVTTNDNIVWHMYLYKDGTIHYHLLHEDMTNFIVTHI